MGCLILSDSVDIERILSKTKPADYISVSTTWVDGRTIFKTGKKWSNCWYGLCAYNKSVFAITPLDYDRPIMINTIILYPSEGYCERAYSCLDFRCFLNRFEKSIFVSEFKDCGTFTIGLPLNISTKTLWFNEGKFKEFWSTLIIPVSGGIIRMKE